jgi:hypothetical protein
MQKNTQTHTQTPLFRIGKASTNPYRAHTKQQILITIYEAK